MKESNELKLKAAVSNNGKSYQASIRVVPVRHDYGGPHHKYSCPICESFGLRFSMPPSTDQCFICGVNLYWDE